jgi:hypothetical protein
VLSLLASAVLAQASCKSDNGCEAARATIVKAMEDVCNQRDAGYGSSQFCRTCVDHGYFSTSGPGACRCERLTFDQDFCSAAANEQALPEVRSAIDFADRSCAQFIIGDASVEDRGEDAGTTPEPADAADAALD